MGNPRRLLRSSLLPPAVALAGILALPAIATAACTLPNGPVKNGGLDDGVNPSAEVVYQGTLTGAMNQNFVQIPFDVGAGVKGLRIRYCYSKTNPSDSDSPTLDLGVYGPRAEAADNWTMGDLRGWSGSALRIVGIAENGYSSESDYTTGDRKAYVPGRTTRAFTPGPMTPGTWAVELGAGWVPPGGVDFKVGIVQSSDAGAWASDPFQPTPYESPVANPKPGWYQGDTHVHGEQEPGNATITETLDLAFSPIVPGDPKAGAGLDFIDLVDHNNANNRLMLGNPAYNRPGKLVIPGSEITTYNGHINSQNASQMVDFRTRPIFRYPKETGSGPFALDQNALTGVTNPNEPTDLFSGIEALGGWSQLNHPTTWATQPSLCRGCAWSFTDPQTGWEKVDAMEIANGIADLNHGNPPLSLNPFTGPAIDLYEQRLAAGDHITATGSSDDHRAARDYGTGTDPVIGQATTVLWARELSPAGVREAIRAGRTYVKVFGADAPDVVLDARTPEGYRGIEGHSMKGRELKLTVKIEGAASNPRPGAWYLSILQNGSPVKTVPVSGDAARVDYATGQTGRYSFRLYRQQGLAKVTEAYSTPVWYTNGKAAPVAPKFGLLKLNRNRGTATVRVDTVTTGQLRVEGKGVRKVIVRGWDPEKKQSVKLVPTGKVKAQLKKQGKATVRLAATFSSEWTEARTAVKKVVLKQKVKRPKRRK